MNRVFFFFWLVRNRPDMHIQTVWFATVRPAHRTAPAQSRDVQSRGTGDRAIRVCHVERYRGPSRRTADSLPSIARPLHRLVENTSRRLPHAFTRRRPALGQDLAVRDDGAKSEDTFREARGSYG